MFLISYILIGAAYFHHYESAFEVESKNLTFSKFIEFRNDFFKKTRALNFSSETSDNIKQKELFDSFVVKISSLKNSQYLITEECLLNETKNDELIWNYSNSKFFATSVLTTIGYGNKLAPETFYGKIGVIIFGIFGIPILMFIVWDIAVRISEPLAWGYKKYYGIKKQVILRFMMARTTELRNITIIRSFFHVFIGDLKDD